MNERIKELRKQAIDFCLDKGSQGNLSEEVATKFAELIIKECATIANEPGARIPGYYIKKHFGVEE